MSKKNESTSLSNLAPAKGSRKTRKRKGLGESSGLGKTAGRGYKGQRARTSGNVRAGFEGGQMPLSRRLPKVGFKSRRKLTGVNLYAVVKTSQLEKLGLSEISMQALKDARLVSGKGTKVKILFSGEVSKKFTVEAHAVSASAKEAIEKKGGEVKLLA
ncbi:MAG: 50S ribosomal protein L15 [Deltaproteobacteria bacterium]|nr:50S ribosomal protein L15 [Deltaproteobacteria bacterium]